MNRHLAFVLCCIAAAFHAYLIAPAAGSSESNRKAVKIGVPIVETIHIHSDGTTTVEPDDAPTYVAPTMVLPFLLGPPYDCYVNVPNVHPILSSDCGDPLRPDGTAAFTRLDCPGWEDRWIPTCLLRQWQDEGWLDGCPPASEPYPHDGGEGPGNEYFWRFDEVAIDGLCAIFFPET